MSEDYNHIINHQISHRELMACGKNIGFKYQEDGKIKSVDVDGKQMTPEEFVKLVRSKTSTSAG